MAGHLFSNIFQKVTTPLLLIDQGCSQSSHLLVCSDIVGKSLSKRGIKEWVSTRISKLQELLFSLSSAPASLTTAQIQISSKHCFWDLFLPLENDKQLFQI